MAKTKPIHVILWIILGVVVSVPVVVPLSWYIISKVSEQRRIQEEARATNEQRHEEVREQAAKLSELYNQKLWMEILVYSYDMTPPDSISRRMIQEAAMILTDSLNGLLKAGKYEKAIDLATQLRKVGLGLTCDSLLEPYGKRLAPAYYTKAKKAFENEEWQAASRYISIAYQLAPENNTYLKLQKRYTLYAEATPQVARAMKNRKVIMGMTREEVVESWGRPHDINRTVYGDHVSEQWVYGDFGPYLYFDDGVLTSWQD